MAIEAIASGLATAVAPSPAPIAPVEPSGDAPFADSLGKLLGQTEAADRAANGAVGRMVEGSGDVHDAMIALQQADLMLQLTVQVRNKIVQAYQDIMRMPV